MLQFWSKIPSRTNKRRVQPHRHNKRFRFNALRAIAKLDTEVVSSPNDKRNYGVITLPNNLQAMLISDPSCTVAAAAMDVSVGYFHDPKVCFFLQLFKSSL